MIELYSHQEEAIKKLRNGSVLCGDVGSGKSRTALAYFVMKECQGSLPVNGKGEFQEMKSPRDIYVITTAKKRDSFEWEEEALPFYIGHDQEHNQSHIKFTVDSWNNIQKYQEVEDAFFIFDEQRVVGYGAWVRSFLKIARANHWILLTATPGDTYSDYMPLFIANGFYKNKTEFQRRHIIFDYFAKYPKIKRYDDTEILDLYRDKILVQMKDTRETVHHDETVFVDYNKELYLKVIRDRWDPYDQCPIPESGKWFYLMRKVVNSDLSRIDATENLIKEHNRAIIFYNFTYELEMLKQMCEEEGITYAEWNGEKHQPLPEGDYWVYLVQYAAGAEGWNCIETNVIIFYSLNYSYKMMKQAAGRIDRMNTPYKDLYFFYLRSRSSIDVAIQRALAEKRNFNEKRFKFD